MIFSQVITQVVLLFIIMAIGYYLRYKGIISAEGVKNFSMLIFYITMPAMILSSIVRTETATIEVVTNIFLASLVSYILLVAMAFILPFFLKVPDSSRGLYRFMALFGNVGYIGFPMLIAVLGKETVFLGALYNIPYNLLLLTLGVFFILSDHQKDQKFNISPKQFLNPGIVMTVVGLVIFFIGGEATIAKTGFEPLIFMSGTVFDIADLLGGITTPLAMIVVGGSLYGIDVKGILKNYRVAVFSLIRMVVFPFAIGVVLVFLGFSATIVSVAIILIGMPIATNTVILANQYEANVLEASEAVFISTLLMIVTAPILIWMIDLLV